MQQTCVQEKSNRATGPPIDTCVQHLAGNRQLRRAGDVSCADRLTKADNEQGAHAVIVLSALANSLGMSVSALIAFEDFLRKRPRGNWSVVCAGDLRKRRAQKQSVRSVLSSRNSVVVLSCV